MIYIREKAHYLNKAFSAPKICTVEAGYFARFVRLPACDINHAPTYIQNNSIRCQDMIMLLSSIWLLPSMSSIGVALVTKFVASYIQRRLN